MKMEEFVSVDFLIQAKIAVLVKKDILKTHKLVSVILLVLVQNQEEMLIVMVMDNVNKEVQLLFANVKLLLLMMDLINVLVAKILFLIIQIANFVIGLLKNRILVVKDQNIEFQVHFTRKQKDIELMIQLKVKMEF